MSQGVVGILLAAGAGTRFGSDKLIYPLADGQPIAVAAASSLVPACKRTIAVLRPNQIELAAMLEKTGCQILFSIKAFEGMGHSLASGVRATVGASGWIVALADMPFITSATHHAVARNLLAGASLVATQYHGHRGHPVGFSKKWAAMLAASTGDQGGKAILERHRDELTLCQVDDPGVIQDIDRREDLKNCD